MIQAHIVTHHVKGALGRTLIGKSLPRVMQFSADGLLTLRSARPEEKWSVTGSTTDMEKRFEGRDEAILDPDLPIIDAHHHLFLKPGQRYQLDDYLDDARAGHRIVASVYVETLAFARDDGPELLRPIRDVEFANGVGAMTAGGAFGDVRICAAIIGHADMRLDDEVGRLLDRCLETTPERFRGVRQITMEHQSEAPFCFMPAKPPCGVIPHPGFRQALRHVARRDLIFDAAVFSHQLPDVCLIADACPDATITLNHMAVAMGLEMGEDERAALFESWHRADSHRMQRANPRARP